MKEHNNQKVNIPENSDMAKYQHYNVEDFEKMMVTEAAKTDGGYQIKLSELGNEGSGMTGIVPAELGFEPQAGMLAIWDGAHYMGADVNLSFYDAEGKSLFEMKRRDDKGWKKVTRTPNANISANSDMAKYQHKNVKDFEKMMVTEAAKTDGGYQIKLSELGREDSGMSGFVPAELGFEPKKGMLAVWDGAHYMGANVNLSFYDAEGKNLFEMKRRDDRGWEKVTGGKENASNCLARMRKKLAQKIDDKLDTNIANVELPKSVKKVEAWMSKSFDNER